MSETEIEKEAFTTRNERVRAAFENRMVSGFTEDELSEFTDTLCDAGLRNPEGQSRAVLRILAMNHVQMRNHITTLDRANSRIQLVFIAFATLSLVGLGVQIYRDFTAEPSVPVVPPASQPGITGNTQKQAAPSNVKGGGTVPQPSPNP